MAMLRWTQVAGAGAGLKNLGNSCYMNSVLQCLASTPPLVNYARTQEHLRSCRVGGFCSLCEFCRLVGSMHSKRVVSPKKFWSNLTKVAPSMRPFKQEDSHEWMRYLMGSMQDVLEKEAKGGDGSRKLPPGVAETTWLAQMFGGYIVNELRCKVCKFSSRRADPFMDLSLEIMGCSTLEECLAHFTQPEHLSGSNAWKCEQCNKLQSAVKQMKIAEAPPVLTMQLKCFTPMGMKRSKHVRFSEKLTLDRFMSKEPADGPMEYSLYAVLVHSGRTTRSGHYTSFVRAPNNVWYHMDDDRVKQVQSSTVLHQEAYILFYVRNVAALKRKSPSPSSTNGRTLPVSLSSPPRSPLSLGGQPPLKKPVNLSSLESANEAVALSSSSSPLKKLASANVASLMTKDLGKGAAAVFDSPSKPADSPQKGVTLLKTNPLKRTASALEFQAWDENDAQKKKQDILMAQQREKELERMSRPGLLDEKLDAGKQKKKRKKVTDSPADVRVAASFDRALLQLKSDKQSKRFAKKQGDLKKKKSHKKKWPKKNDKKHKKKSK